MRDNLERVEERIEKAARRAGRRRDEIVLIGVTKMFPAEAIHEAYELGLRDFGENYVQEFENKFPDVAGLVDARFHLIGHLQSNKSRRAAEIFDVIQTVDSVRLASRLDQAGARLPVMIEVNLSGEESKSGIPPEGLPGLVDALRSSANLELTGLMTMPPWSDDPEVSRPYFRRLRELAGEYGLPHLSIGMSHDLEVAVEEGATHVRVGTALFGPRHKT